MASGYPPELYCMFIILEHFYSLNINKLITNILNFLGIPAILPIVEYVYVLKSAFMVNSSDLKELEAQREMLFAMLLRLCQFNEVSYSIYIYIYCSILLYILFI